MKKRDHTSIDEQVHLALRWGISDVTEDQAIANTKIWNDTNKVDFVLKCYCKHIKYA